MLKELSEKSGLQIITNTGYYAAVDKKFLPEHAYSNSAEELAAAWEKEWKQGINGSGIRPGFIKLGVGKGQLDEMERKIVKAGLLLSRQSGLTVYVHTGGDESILSQYELASEMNFDLSKLVWVHAQNGTDSTRMAMAARGMWISLDGVNEKSLENYIKMISKFRDAGLLHRLLISHDDGWSVEPGEEFTLFNNGNSSPYQTIETLLLPGLTALGFSKEDINTLLIANPAKVLAITTN
jgi:predicted metal-dependent phosphotriesterase family hydrolase